jgi:hypothetical protein
VEARAAVDEEEEFVAVFTAAGEFQDVDLGADIVDTVYIRICRYWVSFCSSLMDENRERK